MTVIGIDVSKWNGNWDARKAKAAGAEFVFMKASQANFVDQRFVESWKKAREAGLVRGAYHYLDYTRPARDQANFYADLLHSDPGDLPPVVDYEQLRPDNNTTLARNYLKEFLEQMGTHGYNPIIYTSPGFWKTYGDTTNYWYQYPLWIANYTSAAAPIVPVPWLNWQFWQFSKKGPGALFGSEALDIDVNRFNGTLDELFIFAQRKPENDLGQRIALLEARVAALEKALPLPATDPAPTTDPVVLPTATVIKTGAPVYSAPYTSSPLIANLNLNQIVEIVESQTGWVHIKSPAGWMEPSSLSQQSGSGGVTPPVAGEYALCRANALNVRTGPATTYPVVGWIQLGERVKILAHQNSWVQLELPTGWCQGSYLTPA